ncbi:MAG: hypothetical protein JNM75_08230 [Rhodospirillales bacterium]|nr:hypothetical protein [Rhodospirillales bacterium]
MLFSTTEGVGYPGGADYGLVALLSISAIVATCAVYASEGLNDMRPRGKTGLRPALTQGLVGAAAGALIAIPLSSAYSIFSRGQGGAAPGLAQISIALVPISVFFSQLLQRFMRQYAHTQRRIVVVGDRTIAGRIASQREIAHEVVGFFELDPGDPLAGGEDP